MYPIIFYIIEKSSYINIIISIQNNYFFLVIDKREGANAILDQDPVITPITKEKANQYNVDPPQIKIQINGINVVKLVYSVLVKVAPTALSI